MIAAPSPYEVPSERFVEQMGNHFLINIIGPKHTFFYIPTQFKEKTLGYDASLQGYKTLVIQYKRLIPNTKRRSGRIAIDASQLLNLQTRFPKAPNAYAFIAYCNHRDYNSIQSLYTSGTGDRLANDIIFIDIHSRLLNTRSKPSSINTADIEKAAAGEALSLPSLATKFRLCTAGVFQDDAKRSRSIESNSRPKNIGNLSFLHARLPTWGTN